MICLHATYLWMKCWRFVVRKEINRQLRKEKRMMKLQQPRTPRNLSIHVEQNEDETPANPGLEIPVLDRDANAEVLMG